MSDDNDILTRLDDRMRRARDEAVVLQKVVELLDPALFSPDEVETMRSALQERIQSAHVDAQELERKQGIYTSKVLKLRELIGRRQHVIDSLQGTYELLERFPEESEVIVETQASLAVDLLHAEADLQR
jgi:hypothetical protein